MPLLSYLFTRIGSGGEVRKLRVTGSIEFSGDATIASPITAELQSGGLVSEVHSSVDISSTIRNPEIAGIAWKLYRGARIQYSVYTGSISWTRSTDAGEAELGGLVAMLGSGSGWAEIRDSYATGSITVDGTAAKGQASVGGLVGLVGQDFQLRLIRSYSAFNVSSGIVRLGGLIGGQDIRSQDSANLQLVSSFWLRSDTVTAAVGSGAITPEDYLSSGSPLPVAPGVNSTQLAQLSTFITEEGSPSGSPGGTEITVTDSARGDIATAPDYRWAIEAGNVGVFIPSLYDDADATTSSDDDKVTNRALFSDTDVARTYQTRGTNLEGSATGYPSLGRVWEICSEENSGFPVLVWENRTCGEGGGGSSSDGGNESRTSNDEDRDDTEAVATTNAPILAATGTPGSVGSVGLVAAILIGLAAILLAIRRSARTAA